MKKWMIVILALAVLCAGCAARDAETPGAEAGNEWGVVMTVENITDSGARVVMEQEGVEIPWELTTGSFYALQTRSGGEWVDTPMVRSDVAWTMEAYLIAPGQAYRQDVSWEWLYGVLSPGHYRIGKNVSIFRAPGDTETAMVWAEFTIGD